MKARAVIVCLVALAGTLPGCVSILNGGGSGERAKDFAVVDTDGLAHNLTSYRGKFVILDLMATWCIPCRAQMEHLVKVRQNYPESRVSILSIGTDPSESDAQLAGFREQFHGAWPFARDTDQVSVKYGLVILPKLIIVDPSGNVTFENQGETYPAAMARILEGGGA